MSKQDPNVGAVRTDPELIAEPQDYPGEEKPVEDDFDFDLAKTLNDLFRPRTPEEEDAVEVSFEDES